MHARQKIDISRFEITTEQRLLILVGEVYFNDDTLLKFLIRGVESKGLIVAFQAPVLADERTGRDEKSPIHVADVVRVSEADLKLRGAQSDSDGVPEHNVDRAVKSNPVNLRRVMNSNKYRVINNEVVFI